MKKLAAISLVLAMTAASLAGCGSTANTAAYLSAGTARSAGCSNPGLSGCTDRTAG